MASTAPQADPAEHNAFFPSPSSLSQYVPAKSDFDGAAGAPQASADRNRILAVLVDERYLPVEGGSFFSTGNHPIETLVPMMHLRAAGYEFDIVTLSGNMAKLELWAMPSDDEAVTEAWQHFLPQLQKPGRLSDVVADLSDDSPYAAVFIPGGHGAMNGLPTDPAMGAALEWALAHDRSVITLCHGPAALLAATGDDGPNLFAGYEAVIFPDALDAGANLEVGYLPGALEWLVAERASAAGITVLNDEMTGAVHRDRQLLTGDSPLAANALGRLAVETLTGGTYSEG